MAINKTCPNKWATTAFGGNPYGEMINKRMSTKNKHWEEYMSKEEDMEFMREIFMPDKDGNLKPLLPFAQYITEWGEHPMAGAHTPEYQKKYGTSFAAKYKIPRPDGSLTSISVVCGSYFYSSRDKPYEVLIHLDDTDREPFGYQTDEDLMLGVARLLNEGETK